MLQFLYTFTEESNYNKIDRIYADYHDYMLKYAISKFISYGSANPIYDAEDAVQNTFVKIVRSIDKINFSIGKLGVKNYCFGILNNEIYNVIGDSEEFLEFDDETFLQDDYTFVENLLIKENYDQVVKLIEAMDEKYSSTLYFFFTLEMSVNDIAEMMGISPKTVYTRLMRGKSILHKSLKGSNEYGYRKS